MGRIKGASIGFAHRGTALKLSARMGASHGGYPNAVKTIGRKNFDPKVYLVTDRRVTAGWKVEEIVEAAIRGDDKSEGVTFVQLRDKHEAWASSVALGKLLRELTLRTRTAFVINDNVELALEVNADGVHVGQDDCNVAEVRAVLGTDAIVGVSAGTREEATQALMDGADYIGVGSVYATGTKSDAGLPIGPEGLADIVACINGRIPVVAIGGISPNNVDACWNAGADGVAIVSAIMKSQHPGKVASGLRRSYHSPKASYL